MEHLILTDLSCIRFLVDFLLAKNEVQKYISQIFCKTQKITNKGRHEPKPFKQGHHFDCFDPAARAGSLITFTCVRSSVASVGILKLLFQNYFHEYLLWGCLMPPYTILIIMITPKFRRDAQVFLNRFRRCIIFNDVDIRL